MEMCAVPFAMCAVPSESYRQVEEIEAAEPVVVAPAACSGTSGPSEPPPGPSESLDSGAGETRAGEPGGYRDRTSAW